MNNIELVQQLKQGQNMIRIENYHQLDIYRKQIQQYQHNNTQYQIMIDFCYSSSFNTIESKTELIEMISMMDSDPNVTVVKVRLNDNHQWNDDLVALMITRYDNVCSIWVDDWNDSVDYKMHQFIKEWVVQQPVITFGLFFYRSLAVDNDGLMLIKQYNQLVQQKQGLQWLLYEHQTIGGYNSAESKSRIEHLIEQVSNS